MYWLHKLNYWVIQSRALDRLASFVLFINTRAWALFLINSYAHVPDMEQDPQAQSLLSPYYLLSPDLLRSVEWFICRRLLQTHFLSLVRHDSGSICGWLMNLCPSPTSKHLHLDIGATYRLRRGGDVPRRISSQGSSAGIAARCWGFNPDKMSSTTAVQKARFSSAFSFLMDTFSLHRRGCNASVQLIGWEYSLKSLWNGAGGRVKVLDWLEQQPIIFEIHLCWI